MPQAANISSPREARIVVKNRGKSGIRFIPPGVDLEGADMETMTKLRDYLTSHGLFTTIRASRGEDIFAACGMLSTAKQEENKQELI